MLCCLHHRGGDSSGTSVRVDLAFLDDGSGAWGNAACGRDSSPVQGQLKEAQTVQVFFSNDASVTILGEGVAATWGIRR